MRQVLLIRIQARLPQQPLLLPILMRKIPAQEDNRDGQANITPKMHPKGNKVLWRVAVQEHLRADGITNSPRDERRGDDGGFLRCAADVARYHGQAEGLRGPE